MRFYQLLINWGTIAIRLILTMLKTSELCDVISYVAYCGDDATMLVSLESGVGEFWVPCTKVDVNLSWRKQATKDIFDIFGTHIGVKRILRAYKVWLPNHRYSYIQHCVLELPITGAQKKNLKNATGKYRGKIRWASKEELFKNYAQNGLKSPELLDYYLMAKGIETQNYPPAAEYHTLGNLVEVNDEVIVTTKQGIFEQVVDLSGINPGYQETLYKEFLTNCFPSIFMGITTFTKFVTELGWAKEEIPSLFRSADLYTRNSLSFRELLYFLAVVEPATAHGGAAAELRCRYIFRYFDSENANALNLDNFKDLMVAIRKSKKEPLDPAKIAVDVDEAYKKMGIGASHPINTAEFLKAVGELKIRGTSQIYRAPISVIKFIKDISEKEFKSRAVGPSLPTTSPTASTLPTKVAGKPAGPILNSMKSPMVRAFIAYELAVHSIKIQKSGAALNIDQLWSLEGAVTESSMKQPPLNDTNRRVSIDQFSQTSQSNELLKTLRLLTISNPKMQAYVKPEQLRYNWGNIDPTTMAKHLISVCGQVKSVFAKEPRLVEISSPVYILGDLHGNFTDLLYFERIFWHVGPCLCPCNLLFLGDYVDRGAYSIEVIAYLFCYKLQSPHKLKMLRGNHEIKRVQIQWTFEKECKVKFGNALGASVFNAVNDAFDVMPIAGVIDSKIFCCHGGIPPPWLCPVAAAINDIPVTLTEPLEQSPLAWEIMWNDPVRPKLVTEKMAMELLANEGFATNTRRGTAHVFNVEALEKFLHTNGFTHIIRAHEVVEAGFTVQQKGKLLTVFSSSKYCGGHNEAACILADQGKLRILRLETM